MGGWWLRLGLEGRGWLGRVSAPRRWQRAVQGGEGTMELLRTITYQPAAGTKMCEQALGKACGGDSKKKRPQPPPEEPQPPQPQVQVQPAASHHHHHHSHSGAEISRIIVDPTTGKRYCRGKVLGKVTSGGRPAVLPGGREVCPGIPRAGPDAAPTASRRLGRPIPARRGLLTCPPLAFVRWQCRDRFHILSRGSVCVPPPKDIDLEARSEGFLYQT